MPGRTRRARDRHAAPHAPSPGDQLRARLVAWVSRIAFGLVLLGAALGPLAPTIESTLILRLILHVFFLMGAALWGIGMALEGRLRLRRTGLGVWLLLFAMAVAAAGVNARYKHPAFITVFLWLTNVLLLIYTVNETRSPRRRLLLLAAVLASAFAAALHGIQQHEVGLRRALAWIEQDETSVLRALNLPADMAYDLRGRIEALRVFGTFVLPNSLAGFLALTIPAWLGLLMDRLGSRWKTERRFAPLFAAVFLTPLALAFYFTKSKGGLAALGIALGLFVLWCLRRTLWKRRRPVLVGILAAMIVAALAQWSGLLPPLRDYAGSLSVRVGYWRGGVEIIRQNALTGIGLDNFSDAYSAVKDASDQEARRAHNDYIQIAAEMGIIGITLYLALWIAFWQRIGRRGAEPILPPTDPAPPPAHTAALVVLFACITFLIEGWCGGSLHNTAKGLWRAWPLFVAVGWGGALLAVVSGASPRDVRRDSYATAGIACGLVGFLVHSVVDLDHYVAGTFQTVWLFMGLVLSACLSEEKETWTVDRPLGAAARLGLILGCAAPTLAVLYGYVLPVADAQMLCERARDFDAPITLAQRRDLLKRAAARYPSDAETHAQLSDILFFHSQTDPRLGPSGQTSESEAVRHIRDAIALNPMRAEYYARLGRILEFRWLRGQRRNRDDYLGALDAYQQAEDLFPSNPDTALNVARLHDMAGESAVALGKYLRALDLSERQYHIPRKFTADEARELRERVDTLNRSVADRTPPPPIHFTSPRLLGLPRIAGATKPAD